MRTSSLQTGETGDADRDVVGLRQIYIMPLTHQTKPAALIFRPHFLTIILPLLEHR